MNSSVSQTDLVSVAQGAVMVSGNVLMDQMKLAVVSYLPYPFV